jgi:hypothetical protein
LLQCPSTNFSDDHVGLFLTCPGFLSHLRPAIIPMNQKSPLPQRLQSVLWVLAPDTCHL